MIDAKRTEDALASVVGVDVKTVSRWLNENGRTPHPRHRYAACEDLGVDEAMIWPETVRGAVKTGPDREVLTVYPSHSSVPKAVWQKLVADAAREIVFCDTCSYWMWYDVADLTHILRAKAEAGCRIRVIVGKPDDDPVRADEAATDVPMTLTARIEQTKHLLQPLRDVVEVRETALGFGRSVYRGDDAACAHWWLHGTMGIDFPVLHLKRHQDAGIFDQIAVNHVEALWEAAEPV